MTNICIDIETIPSQREGVKERFIEESVNNFKAPSSLTKGKACEDLGLTGDKAKYTSKDDAIRMWEQEMAPKLAESVGIDKWRKTSLDASQGEIISIALITDNDEICLHRKLGNEESELISSFYEKIANLVMGRHVYMIGHNIKGFDLPFIFRRSVINRVKPSVDIKPFGNHGQDFYDTMVGWCGYKDTISQDNLCKALDIAGKPGDISGANVWDHIEAGDYERVIEYNLDDAKKVRQIYNRLTFKS